MLLDLTNKFMINIENPTRMTYRDISCDIERWHLTLIYQFMIFQAAYFLVKVAILETNQKWHGMQNTTFKMILLLAKSANMFYKVW